MSWMKDTLKIDGRDIPIQRGEIDQGNLRFYPENPRLYSILRPDEREPDQAEIERRLRKMEHVKALIQDIKSNGGLIDPIIVRDGTLDVLEGNSRLAAYRRLAESDPIKWGRIKCILLPSDINQSLVFRILGQYHIVGKKNWAPFEQAGFLYRRHKLEKVGAQQISQELGLALRDVKSLIATYEFMVENDDTDISRWSYYYEMLKSRKIAGLCRKHADLQPALIAKIKSGEINKAVDIRDGVAKLVTARDAVVRDFISGDATLDEALKRLDRTGGSDESYLRLRRFRTWLVESETEAKFDAKKESARKKIIYELNQIKRHVERIRSSLEDD
jgi:hypothetical protein